MFSVYVSNVGVSLYPVNAKAVVKPRESEKIKPTNNNFLKLVYKITVLSKEKNCQQAPS